MTSLLWERRTQIGLCLLIQALCVAVGAGLERLQVQPQLESPAAAPLPRVRL